MRIVSFNTNGIRAREHQLERLRDELHPDVIGIQETKVHDDMFPLDMMERLGYHAEYFGQKGHYGVALLSLQPPERVFKGLPGEDEADQRRMISATYTFSGRSVSVMNGYFPQGESRDHPEKFPNKARFYRNLLDTLQADHDPGENLVVVGDMNVAPLDQDIGIGADNAKRWLRSGKCSFLPEEREWLQRLMDWGLKDTFRVCHPDVDDRFSWFDYRSKGFDREPKRGLRIDLIMATEPLIQRLSGAGISYEIRAMQKPSDHAPIWADFDL